MTSTIPHALSSSLKVFLFIWIVFIPMKTSFYQISSFAISIIFIFLFFKDNFLKTILYQKYKSIILPFLFVIFSMVLSNSINLIDRLDSWKIIIYYVFRYFLIFLTLLYAFEQKMISRKFVFISFMASLSLQAIDGVYQSLFGYDFLKQLVASLDIGLSGATFNRNVFGLFMAIGASLCTNLIFKNKDYRLKRMALFFSLILLLMFLYCLLFSYSRSAWLFYAIFITSLFCFNHEVLTIKHFLFLMILLTSVAILFYSSPQLMARFHQLVSGEDSARYSIWINTISFIKESPFFGYGLITYDTVGLSNPNAPKIASIHNSVLEILFFLGSFGFIAFSYLLYAIYVKIVDFKDKAYLSFFISSAIITLFDHSIISGMTNISALVILSFFIYSHTPKTLSNSDYCII